MDASRYYGSKTLKAADLPPKGLVCEIVDVIEMEFKEEGGPRLKLVAQLKDMEKLLVMNATNAGIMIEATSKDTDTWIGCHIHIARHKVGFGTQRVDGITIKEVTVPSDKDKEGAK